MRANLAALPDPSASYTKLTSNNGRRVIVRGGGLTPDKLDRLRQLLRDLQGKINQQTGSTKLDDPRGSSRLRKVGEWYRSIVASMIASELSNLIPQSTRNAIKQKIYASSSVGKKLDDLPYVVTLSNLNDLFSALDILVSNHAVVWVLRRVDDQNFRIGALPIVSYKILCDLPNATILELALKQAEISRVPEPEEAGNYSPLKTLTRAEADRIKSSYSYMA